MVTFRESREERVPDGIEDRVVRDFEGGGQRQVGWVEEGLACRGIFI